MELRNANGPVPVDVVRRDRDRYAISFVPQIEGMIMVTEYWNTTEVAEGTKAKRSVAYPPRFLRGLPTLSVIWVGGPQIIPPKNGRYM